MNGLIATKRLILTLFALEKEFFCIIWVAEPKLIFLEMRLNL